MKLRIWWHRIRRREVTVHDGHVYGYLTRSEYRQDDRCIRIPDEVEGFNRRDRSYEIQRGWGRAKQSGHGFIYSGTVHPDLRWTADDALAYYESTGFKFARVTATRRKRGIWLEGVVHPFIVEAVDNGPLVLSGDWRTVSGLGMSLIAVLKVDA